MAKHVLTNNRVSLSSLQVMGEAMKVEKMFLSKIKGDKQKQNNENVGEIHNKESSWRNPSSHTPSSPT